jgi:hypothetical protein
MPSKFLLADDGGTYEAAGAVGQDGGIAQLDAARIAELELGQLERAERLDETEAGHLVVGKHVGGDDPAIVGRQPDFLGLGDEVADGQHQAVVADDDAAAFADGAQRRGGEGVVRDVRAQGDDGVKDRFDIHWPDSQSDAADKLRVPTAAGVSNTYGTQQAAARLRSSVR